MSQVLVAQKTLFEVLQTIASDGKIKQLLIDDSNDLSAVVAASTAEMFSGEYVSMVPSIEFGINKTTRNSFVLGQIENITVENEGLSMGGVLYVGTDREHIVLTENRNRLLLLVDRIMDILQNQKFSASGQLKVTYISSVTFTEYCFGYRISFNFADQYTIEKAEI